MPSWCKVKEKNMSFIFLYHLQEEKFRPIEIWPLLAVYGSSFRHGGIKRGGGIASIGNTNLSGLHSFVPYIFLAFNL
jgi:hypothetical protein